MAKAQIDWQTDGQTQEVVRYVAWYRSRYNIKIGAALHDDDLPALRECIERLAREEFPQGCWSDLSDPLMRATLHEYALRRPRA